jgi:Asp-tRNA(Asn)/Glu-tRNA(Gln) amidotransferase A subunit family amidase
VGTVADTAERIRLRAVTAADVLAGCRRQVERRNGSLTAFTYLDWDQAERCAARVDAELDRGGDPGPLAGVPFGVKDIENCAGLPTTYGSLAFLNAPPQTRDDPGIARLRRAGAIPVGKTATPEFALDSITASPAFGVTRNPWDLSRTPGGSSGGSAAAVAAGLVPFATGTDDGGSVRSPAAFCGLVGLKPTLGLIPRGADGQSDLNAVSVLASTALDTARLLDVMAGRDDVDKMSQDAPVTGALEADLAADLPRGLRALWSPDLGYVPVDREVAAIAGRAAAVLCAAARCDLSAEPRTFSNANTAVAPIIGHRLRSRLEYLGVWPAHAGDMANGPREWLERHGWPTPREYGQALALRAQVEAEVADFFADHDLLLTPSVACPAFAAAGPVPALIDGKDASATGAEAFSMIANAAWVPAISIPAGLTADGLPVGLQVIGRRWSDGLLLRLARLMESAQPWPPNAPNAPYASS